MLRLHAPFAAMTAVAYALAFSPGPRVRFGEWLIAAALVSLSGLWRLRDLRRGPEAGVVASLLFLASIGVLRDAVSGTSGGVGIMVMLPIVWTALHGNRRELLIVVTGAALTLALPQIVVGAPAYPATGWRSTILLVALGSITGRAVQALVCRLRESMSVALERELERDVLLTQLQRLAETDPLTALGNRRAFEARLDALLEWDADEGPFCVALLDLDHFKEVNDRDGHRAGDRILQGCAAGWTAALRPGDMLARFGGDEFALLLPGCSLEDGREVLTRLRQRTPSELTVSAGLAARHAGDDRGTLLHRADLALYSAKARGRDLLAVADRPPLSQAAKPGT